MNVVKRTVEILYFEDDDFSYPLSEMVSVLDTLAGCEI